MNPFFLSSSERLADWKELRENIASMPEQDAFRAVSEYWARAPMMKMAYDPEHPEEWPLIWEMISNGDWCPFSVAIGMESTLRLSGLIDPSRMEVLYIRDYEISDTKYILKIDNNTVLNYTVGEVEEYPTSSPQILARFKNDGKRYFEI